MTTGTCISGGSELLLWIPALLLVVVVGRGDACMGLGGAAMRSGMGVGGRGMLRMASLKDGPAEGRGSAAVVTVDVLVVVVVVVVVGVVLVAGSKDVFCGR